MKLETMQKLYRLINHPRSANKHSATYPREQIDEVLKVLKDGIVKEIEKQKKPTNEKMI